MKNISEYLIKCETAGEKVAVIEFLRRQYDCISDIDFNTDYFMDYPYVCTRPTVRGTERVIHTLNHDATDLFDKTVISVFEFFTNPDKFFTEEKVKIDFDDVTRVLRFSKADGGVFADETLYCEYHNQILVFVCQNGDRIYSSEKPDVYQKENYINFVSEGSWKLKVIPCHNPSAYTKANQICKAIGEKDENDRILTKQLQFDLILKELLR